MGLKTDDCFTFPLCQTCHTAFDQVADIARDEKRYLADQWILDTIRRLALDGTLKVKT